MMMMKHLEGKRAVSTSSNHRQQLMNHMCGGVVTPKDVLSNAMKHANELLSRMDLLVEGSFDWASSMFVPEITYATF